MTEKELLAGFLSKTLNMDAAGVASLYNEDGSLKPNALTMLEEKDIERVKKLKPDETAIFNDAHKKAKAEILKGLEKEFSDKTSFKSDKKGIELFLAYAEDQRKKAGDQLTEDEIKKHPLFISTVDKLNEEKTKAIEAKETEFNTFKKELSKKETFSSVSQKALEAFHALKPILSKDPIKAKAQEELFIKQLQGHDYEIQGDKIIVLKEGKVLEDPHGNRIPFEKIIRQTAETYYDFHVTDPKSSPGNGKAEPSGQQQKFQVVVPKNEQEYAKAIIDKTKTVEERKAIQEAYKATQTTN